MMSKAIRIGGAGGFSVWVVAGFENPGPTGPWVEMYLQDDIINDRFILGFARYKEQITKYTSALAHGRMMNKLDKFGAPDMVRLLLKNNDPIIEKAVDSCKLNNEDVEFLIKLASEVWNHRDGAP